jgi:nitroimidazol reductase NimA-like FMN-containing flavoprotein (pyridoxamine 5'-phosphate oxidase superfamily)
LRSDGSPFVIPVGFLYEDGAIHLTFRPDHAAVRRVRRDARVSVTVFNDRFPVRFAVIAGEAEILEDPGLEFSVRKHRWIMQLAEEWLDQEQYEHTHFEPGRLVIRIPVTPGNVATSDLAKIPLPIVAGATRPGW